MSEDVFQHPNRFPKSAPGPFYTTGFLSTEPDEDGNCEWGGNCLWCGAPEAEAPELFAPFDDKSYTDTYITRQPETPEETEKAIMAAKVCCVFAVRYGGQDRSIIRRLGNDPELCDYIVEDGELRLTVADDGEFLPFAAKIVKKNRAERRRRNRKWWQFWV